MASSTSKALEFIDKKRSGQSGGNPNNDAALDFIRKKAEESRASAMPEQPQTPAPAAPADAFQRLAEEAAAEYTSPADLIAKNQQGAWWVTPEGRNKAGSRIGDYAKATGLSYAGTMTEAGVSGLEALDLYYNKAADALQPIGDWVMDKLYGEDRAGYIGEDRAAYDAAVSNAAKNASQYISTPEDYAAAHADVEKLTTAAAEAQARAEEGLSEPEKILGRAAIAGGQMAADYLLGGGVASMMPMVIRSFGGGVQNAREKGYTKEQQIGVGLATALTEYASEKLFGGNPVYDSDVGLVNRLVARFTKNPTVMKVLTSAPADVVYEALEEIIADVFDPLTEAAITGTPVDFPSIDQFIEDGVVGALMAVMGLGASSAVNGIGAFTRGQAISLNEDLQNQLIAYGATSAEGSDAAKLAERAQRGRESASGVNSTLWGRLANAVEAENAERANAEGIAQQYLAQEESGKINPYTELALKSNPYANDALTRARSSASEGKSTATANATAEGVKTASTAPIETMTARSQIEAAAKRTGFGETGLKEIVATMPDGVDLTNADSYFSAFDSFYEAGRNNSDIASVQNANASILSPEAQKIAYNAGVSDAAAKAARKPGLVRDEAYLRAKLTTKEARTLDALGKVLGTEIRIADKLDAQIEVDGKTVTRSANAQFSDGVITISASAKDPVIAATVHETVHNIKQVAPEAYNALAKFVSNNMSEEFESLNKGALRAAGYSENEIDEEMVANAFGRMLNDQSLLERFVRDDRTAAQKFFDALKDLATKISRVLKGNAKRLSTMQRFAYTDLQNKVDAMISLYEQALKTAGEYHTNGGKPAPASITPEFAEAKNSIAPPYSANSAAYKAFVESLDSKARETFDLFNSVHEYGASHLVSMMVGAGKAMHMSDGSDITTMFMTAQKWNENCNTNPDFADAARGLVALLPDDVRTNGHFMEDGTIDPTILESEFKMERSFAQRVVDALPIQVVSPVVRADGRDVKVSNKDKIKGIGGEAYRRALVEERRKLFAEGKLPTRSISYLHKDNWGTMGFLATNTKTVASGDFTTICPQMMFNRGCFYCYRRAALETGVNNKLSAESVWYTGEILMLTDEDVKSLNELGGLRIQSFGDWMEQFSAQLADLLIDAQKRGLQIKFITKETNMIDTVALLREQGIGLNLYFNLSSDYVIEPQGKISNKDGRSSLPSNYTRPHMTTDDGRVWWKRALTPEEAFEWREKYPFVNVRIVAHRAEEFIRALKDPRIQVVTGYHGKIRHYERYDSTTGEHIGAEDTVIYTPKGKIKNPDVEPIGDNGMPWFVLSDDGSWSIDPNRPGKNKYQKQLAQQILDEGLVSVYYMKACCVTGRCESCQGKCGKVANDFYVKNATNADSGSVAYWQENMIDMGEVMEQLNPQQRSVIARDQIRWSLPEPESPRDYAPTFFSKLEREIEKFKGDRIGAASVASYLKGHGVTDEEIKWSGIQTFLEGKKSVDKAELLGYLRDSRVFTDIEERSDESVAAHDSYTDEEVSKRAKLTADIERLVGVVPKLWEAEYGEPFPEELSPVDINADSTIRDAVRRKMRELGRRQVDRTDNEQRLFETANDILDAHMELNDIRSGKNDRARSFGTRWDQYALPGGENYREYLFRIPSSSFSNDAMGVHWGKNARGILAHARVQDFWADPDPITGELKKVLFIDEIQSDWHNAGQKYGYRSGDNADYEAELNRRQREADKAFDDLAAVGNQYEALVTKLQTKINSTSTFPWTYAKVAQTLLIHQLGSAASWGYEAEIFNEALQSLTDDDRVTLETYVTALETHNKASSAVAQMENAVEDAPYAKTYQEFVLKNLLRMAAEGDYDYLAWTTGKMQEERWSDEYAEGYRIEYDQEIPGFLKKYGKQWGEAPTSITLYGLDTNLETVPAIAINGDMKDSVLYEGQPSFGRMYSLQDEDYSELRHKLDALYKEYASAVNAPKSLDPLSVYRTFSTDDESIVRMGGDPIKATEIARRIQSMIDLYRAIPNESAADWAIRQYKKAYSDPQEMLQRIQADEKENVELQTAFSGEWDKDLLDKYLRAYEQTDFSDIESVKRLLAIEADVSIKNDGAYELLGKKYPGDVSRYSLSDRDILDDYIRKYGAIKPGEKRTNDVDLPQRTKPRNKVSMTARTAVEAAATPKEMVKNIEELAAKDVFSYTPYSDKAAIKDAADEIQTRGWKETLGAWLQDVAKGKVSKKNTALGWALYDNAANSGDTETALLVLRNMIRHQRSAAQAVQATRILKEMGPQAQLYNVAKSVEELQREINERYGDKNAPQLEIDPDLADAYNRATTDEERDRIVHDIYKDIGRQLPSRFIDRWNAWRYLAMLGNPRTHLRNIAGNAFFAPVVAAKNLTATGIEAAVSFLSGGKLNRTKALVIGKKGGGELLKAAWADYANIKDEALGEGKYNDAYSAMNADVREGQRVFSGTKNAAWNRTVGTALDAIRKFNGDALNVEDVWFSQPHYAFALAQYCKANGITADQISSGKGLEAAREYAIEEAQKATYRDTNAFSDAVSQLGRGGAWSKNKVTKAISTAVEGILPFRKTPANILVRGVEYSPIGLLKSITYDAIQVKNGNMSGAKMIDHLAAGLTGTGLVMLGVFLSGIGLVRGHGSGDEKKKKAEELAGHQPYSLELPGGKSITLDWLAPECLPFFIGVNIAERATESKSGMKMSDVLQAVSNISEPMLEMSCLQGLNDLFDSNGYAKSNGVSALTAAASAAATSYLMQGLPTIFGQAERTTEDKRDTTYTDKNKWLSTDVQYALGKASNKIPIWEYGQIPYIDAWGKEDLSGNFLLRAWRNFLNPSYVDQVDRSAMEKELIRLYDKTGDSGVLPSRAEKYFTSNGVRKDLTGEQYVKYATARGQTAYALIGRLTSDSGYKALSDDEKADVINLAYDYATYTARTTVGGTIPDSKKWVSEALEGRTQYGISPDYYILLYNQVADISSLKKSDGGSIANSKGLQVMELIYNTKGLSDKQRRYLFECFDVGSSVIDLSREQVKSKLAAMK